MKTFFLLPLLITASVQPGFSQSVLIEPIVLVGQEAPGTGGGKFSHFEYLTDIRSGVSINDKGQVAFLADIAGSSIGKGVFLFSDSAIRPVALQGDAVPGRDGEVFTGFSTPLINSAGHIAFRGSYSREKIREGIFLYTGAFSPLVFSDEYLDVIGGQLRRLYNFSLNDADEVAFSTRGSIFMVSQGDLSVVARSRDLDAIQLDVPSLNNAGQVAFLSYRKRLGIMGTPIATDIMLFTDGQLNQVYSVGDDLTGPYPTEPALLNNGGTVAFALPAGAPRVLFFYSEGTATRILLPHEGPINSLWILSFNDREALAFRSYCGLYILEERGVVKLLGRDEPVPGEQGGRLVCVEEADLNNRNAVAFIGVIEGGTADEGIFLARLEQKLFFAHFADGSQQGSSISSEITLTNLDSAATDVEIELRDDAGEPLEVDLNGETVAGRLETVIPPDGTSIFGTDGKGSLRAGSLRVRADREVAGLLLFQISGFDTGSDPIAKGLAGMAPSDPLTSFVIPVKEGAGLKTGLAFMGLGEQVTIALELRDEQGDLIARSKLTLGPRSHLARFVKELGWDTPPDLSRFGGKLTGKGNAEFAVSAILMSATEITTVPVATVSW